MDHHARLRAYAVALRELVHRGLAAVVTEEWLHEKRLLARHAHDDADLVAELLARLRLPTPTASVLADRDAYADVKPSLAAAAREQLGELDLDRDREDAELLNRIASRQELHVLERPARHAAPDGVLALAQDGPSLSVEPAPDEPGRDPFVLPGPGGEGAHAQLNAAILAGEVAARTAHEHPGAEWDFHRDLARVAADRLAATDAFDRELAAAGIRWGDQPVSLGGFAAVLALDVSGRLAFAADPGDPAHAEIAARWGRASE